MFVSQPSTVREAMASIHHDAWSGVLLTIVVDCLLLLGLRTCMQETGKTGEISSQTRMGAVKRNDEAYPLERQRSGSDCAGKEVGRRDGRRDENRQSYGTVTGKHHSPRHPISSSFSTSKQFNYALTRGGRLARPPKRVLAACVGEKREEAVEKSDPSSRRLNHIRRKKKKKKKKKKNCPTARRPAFQCLRPGFAFPPTFERTPFHSRPVWKATHSKHI